MLEETPGGRAALRAMVPHELAEIVERAEPSRLPAWTSVLDLREGVLSLGEVRYFAVRARSTEGRALGTIYLYGSTLPATLLALVQPWLTLAVTALLFLLGPSPRTASPD